MIEIPCIIKVDSEEKSIAVQKMLFSMDIIWASNSTGRVQNTGLDLLYIEREFNNKATITGSYSDYLININRNGHTRYNSWRSYDAEELLCFETFKLL